ncbi:hypothetical protein SAMN04490244_10985 [Tranquillimonas rosea]|uniref:Uncharacterized protein n=1 Tax=Tranquillimonas rosea TaxID=641238 RepID=A0A1H9W4E2_9RHOB|nr:hypothetical protein [Tranquillimonas rosea]SES28820.1 hypothetical protein SAMN04490244_10985 [Tranquillimonas rosea]
MRRAAAIAVTALVALPAAAQELTDFDGRYRPGPTEDCNGAAGEGEVVTVEDNVFTGVEARCDMTRPVNVRDMEAVLYDMQCESGDDSWTDRAMLMRAPEGGLIMVWDGYAFKYDACESAPAQGTVTRAEDIGIIEEE